MGVFGRSGVASADGGLSLGVAGSLNWLRVTLGGSKVTSGGRKLSQEVAGGLRGSPVAQKMIYGANAI